MRIKSIAANQTEVHLMDGTVVLVSYETPVAAFIPAQGYFYTSTKYSRTTTKHINSWLPRMAAKMVDQSFFDSIME